MHQTNELIPTRRTLLSRLKDWDNQESWREFFDTYWWLIYNVAIKSGLTPAEAEDAVQETIISVMKSIGDFHYDPQKGSFKSWLLNLTRWRIVDQLRKRNGLPRQEDQTAASTRTDAVERVAEPRLELEAIWDQEWEANLLHAAVERVKRKVDPRHYQVFDLLVLQKWPVSKAARFLGLSAARIYLIKHRVGALVKKEAASLRTRPL